MPKKMTTAEQPSPAFQYASLDDYLAEVRKLLLGKQLRAGWVDELISGDDVYLLNCFENRAPPLSAAFELYITEEESAREPVQVDLRLKIALSEQAKPHIKRLVELGLWGASVEEVAKTLVEQALATKLEAGLLQAPCHK